MDIFLPYLALGIVFIAGIAVGSSWVLWRWIRQERTDHQKPEPEPISPSLARASLAGRPRNADDIPPAIGVDELATELVRDARDAGLTLSDREAKAQARAMLQQGLLQ